MDQNVGQAPSTKRSKRLAVRKINFKNKRSFSSLSKGSPSKQARVTILMRRTYQIKCTCKSKL